MDISNSRVLIVGCGFVGRQLALELVRAGATVWGLSRTPRDLPHGVNPVAADITQPHTLEGRLPEVTHVVFAASAGGSSDEQYRAVYVSGTSNVFAALQQAAVQRIGFVSSTAVYAQQNGVWIDEESPTLPTHFAGLRMLEAERVVATARIPSVILRCAGIYGPSRTRLIDSVRQGEASYDPSAPRFTNRIHRDDVALALVHLLFMPKPAPVYVGVDEYPAPEGEVFEFLASLLSVPPPQAKGARDTTRGNSNKRCSSALLRRHGYTFQFPTFREGYGAMLRHSRDA
jgi:nucleoside-diphosphate-sugar epimerase